MQQLPPPSPDLSLQLSGDEVREESSGREVLKPSPPANIENQNGVKSTLRSKRIAEELLQRISAFQ